MLHDVKVSYFRRHTCFGGCHRSSSSLRFLLYFAIKTQERKAVVVHLVCILFKRILKRMHTRSSSDLIILSSSKRRQSRSWPFGTSSAVAREGSPDLCRLLSSKYREDETDICRLSTMHFVYMLSSHPLALSCFFHPLTEPNNLWSGR